MIAYGELTISEIFDGVSVSSVDVWFYPSTSQTTLTGGQWTTNAPSSVNGIWIWTKTVTTLSNGTKKESSPACVTGNTGTPGKSVDKIDEEYYLSSSKTEQVGSSWVRIPPSWTYGKYMWTRIKITYKNPTSVEYSQPICDTSWEAANDFKEELESQITETKTELSGVNTKVDQVEKSITNKVWKSDITSQINNYDGTTVKTIRDQVSQNKTEIGKITTAVSDVKSTLTTKADGSTVQSLSNRVSKVEQDASGFQQTVEQTYVTKGDFNNLKIGGRNLVLQSNNEFKNNGYCVGTYNISPSEGTVLKNGCGHLVENEKYVATICWTPGKTTEYMAMYLSEGYMNVSSKITSNGTQTKHIQSFNFVARYSAGRYPSDDPKFARIQFYRFPTQSSTTHDNNIIHWIKIEKGNKATDWTPAPEDNDSAIQSVKSELTQRADKIEAKVTSNDGKISSLTTDVNGITGRIENAEGKITTLTSTASGLSTQVQNSENNISKLQQTASTLSTDVSNAKGEISTLKQTATILQTKVQNAEGNISTLKQTANTLSTDISNAKGDISKLQQKTDSFSVEVSKTMRTNVEEFYLSTSHTSLAGGTWSTSAPTWTQGKYIWRRTLVTYADGKSKYTPSENGVCITGNTGTAGKGIKTTTVSYQAGTSGTVPPTGTWNSTIPSVSLGQYLWSRTITTYTDNSSSTSYSVAYIPKNGTPGNTGQTGTGVENMIPQFYLSTSKTAQIGGAWVTTMPVWSNGKYLWKRYQIIYKNPTSTVYTTPECDSSWEAVNEVQVGGRNLLRDSKGDFVLAPRNAGVASDNYNYRAFYADMLLNETYTISADIEITHGDFTSVTVAPYTGGKMVHVPIPKNKRIVHTFTKNNDGIIQVLIYAGISGQTRGNGIIIRNVKIEKGNKATDWTPAPEDVQAEINQVRIEYKADLKIESDRITTNVSATDALGKRLTTVEQTADNLKTKVSNNEGKISTLEQTASGLKTEVSNAKGEISTLKQTASGLSVDVSNAKGNISVLQQTANGLSTRVESAEGNISSLQQASNSLSSKIQNAEGNISTLQQTANGLQISLNNTNTNVVNAAKTATNFLIYDSINGLQVGNKTSGTWSGYRTQIKSDSFNILDQNGNILSSYGADKIKLGAGSDKTIISLCGDKGSIWYDSNAKFIELGSDNVRVRGKVLSSLYSITDTNRSGYNAYTNRLEMYSYTGSKDTGSTINLNDTKMECFLKDKMAISAPNGVEINGTVINMTQQTLLYNGVAWLDDSNKIINFSKSITSFPNGIVLVFSLNENGVGQEWAYSTHFIPKSLLSDVGEKPFSFVLSAETFNITSVKFCYISNTRVVGHYSNAKYGTNNGITYDNRRFCLRRIYGV